MCVTQKPSTRGGLKLACPPAKNHLEEKEKRDERRAGTKPRAKRRNMEN